MPALVLLDLDGTLLDGAGLPGAMRRTCEELARGLPGVTPERIVAANTAAWERAWPEVEDDYMLGGRTGASVQRDVWTASLAECGVDDERAVDRAVTLWARHERSAVRLFPDVLPALDELDRRGARTGMVTNGAASVQRGKLDAVGLADRFDPLVISSEAGAKKPDPAVFELALHAAGASPDETVFVGDNLWHDVPGAAEVGIRTIWIDRLGVPAPPDAPRPDRVIRDLAEL